MSLNAQYKLAARLEKQKRLQMKIPPMKSNVDVPMSSEMVEWMQDTLGNYDDNGYLPETISSVLAKPLDGMSVFCPTGAIATSKYSASRGPHANLPISGSAQFESWDNESGEEIMPAQPTINKTLGQTKTFGLAQLFGFGSSQQSVTAPAQPIVKINDAVSRLNVLWLQRKASIERSDGDLDSALKTLDQAIELHLGTSDYMNAKLGEHVMTSDPTELLVSLEENYFVYDESAHLTASRIQRFYHRHYTFRCNAAIMVSKLYRGYRCREAIWQLRHLRKQSAQLIQRRFRIHLIRMHALATKIKRWYKMRVQMREYHRRLHIYRMARRIQRLFRGNKGRAIAARKRLELISTGKIQKNARAHNLRFDRAFALSMYHRMFYMAARKIQCLVRKIQAVRRAQLQLLREIARENDRYRRERLIIAETIRIELTRTRLYLRTDAGQCHLRNSMRRISLQDKKFAKLKSTLSDEAVMAQEAMTSFELFDNDGSGFIDEDELSNIMRELCIPMNKRAISALASEIDVTGSGEIDFGQFLDWYCGGGSDAIDQSASIGDDFFRQLLEARHVMMELSGQILYKRSERDVLRQSTAWLTRDIVSTFRLTHAPKFQCCQCQKPFVMFTDYYMHFQKGKCGVLNERALFYDKFWLRRDWNYQRQCEHEVMRLNDETPNVRSNANKAVFGDLSLQNDIEVALHVDRHVRAAQIIFLDKMENFGKGSNKAELKTEISQQPLVTNNSNEPVDIAASTKQLTTNNKQLIPEKGKLKSEPSKKGASIKGSSSKKSSAGRPPTLGEQTADIVNFGDTRDAPFPMSPFVATAVSLRLKCPMPEDWLIDNVWNRDVVTQWVIDQVDKVLSKRRKWCEFTKRGRMKREAWLLADVYIHTLRIMAAEAEAELIALMDFRTRRKRRITIDDDELLRMGLDRLTYASYCGVHERVVDKLAKIDAAMLEVHMVNLPRCCDKLLWGTVNKQVQVGPNGTLTPEAMRDLMTIEAHVRAHARYKSRLRSKIGRAHLKRLTRELWSFERLMSQSSDIQFPGLKYLFDRFADTYQKNKDILLDGNLDWRDFDMLEKCLGLKTNETQNLELKAVLDPHNSGKVSFSRFADWVDDMGYKPYNNTPRIIRNTIVIFLRVCSSTLYQSHAKQNMASNIRRMARLEYEYRTRSIKTLVNISTHRKQQEQEQLEIKQQQLVAAAATNSISPLLAAALPIVNTTSSAAAAAPATSAEDSLSQIVRQTPEEFESGMKVAENELKNIQRRLTALREWDAMGELRLLFRLAEDEAEWECIKSFVSRQGVADIITESKLMWACDAMIAAHGHCITVGADYPWTAAVARPVWRHISMQCRELYQRLVGQSEQSSVVSYPPLASIEPGWLMALGVLVHAFDTDCSGAFDEGEVRLLLTCVLCGLPERHLLLEFPEARLGSVNMETLVTYLAVRVGWQRGVWWRFGKSGRLRITKMMRSISCGLMLISLNRQIARARTEQATTLSRTGQLLDNDDDDVNDASLMTRTQMLAMRQVKMFLPTRHGQLKLQEATAQTRMYWRRDVIHSEFSRTGLFKFAYHVHCEWKGLLITELPFLIQFLINNLNFKPSARISEAAIQMNNVNRKSNLRWFSEREIVKLLDPWFKPEPTILRNETSTIFSIAQQSTLRLAWKTRLVAQARRKAGSIRMYARARQQAVLIAMRFSDVLVADSNYRCSILGLHAIVSEKRRTAIWGILKPKPKLNIDWSAVPREAMTLLLLSRGYTLKDMTSHPISQFCGTDHSEGAIIATEVDVREALDISSKAIFETLTFSEQVSRWFRFMGNFNMSTYVEYCRVAKAIKQHPGDCNAAGADFLREIITGVSHCVQDKSAD